MSTIRRVLQNSAFNFMASVSQRVGQAVIFILIARRLTAENIGSFRLATTFTGILLTLSFWGLDHLLIRDVAQNRKVAGYFLSNFLLIRIVLAMLMWLGLALVIRLFPYPDETKRLILVMAATIIPGTVNSLYQAVWIALENMKIISALTLLFSMIRLAGGGWILWQRGELLLITYWFLVISVIELLTTVWITHRSIDVSFPGKYPDFAFWCQNIKLATPLIFVSFVLTVEYQLDSVILSFWSVEEVGLYGTAVTILTLCLFLSSSFQLAIFPVFSRAYQVSQSRTQRVYSQSIKFLLFGSLPIALIISSFSTQIIQTIFGSDYQAAGPMLKVLIWAFFISALNVSNSRMLIVANHQQTMALFALFSMVGNITLSLLLVPRFGGMGTAWARILAMPLYSIPAMIYVQRHITKINWYDFWRFDLKFSGEQQ